jgi:threonylcarbamoyladenosine tRNA methylthiotransferase MtaB
MQNIHRKPTYQPTARIHLLRTRCTKALSIEPIVPINERRRRNEILQQVSDSKLNSFYQSQQGKDAIVLWEDSKKGDMMHGFTENYVKVETKYNKNLVNTFEKITIKTV